MALDYIPFFPAWTEDVPTEEQIDHNLPDDENCCYPLYAIVYNTYVLLYNKCCAKKIKDEWYMSGKNSNSYVDFRFINSPSKNALQIYQTGLIMGLEAENLALQNKVLELETALKEEREKVKKYTLKYIREYFKFKFYLT